MDSATLTSVMVLRVETLLMSNRIPAIWFHNGESERDKTSSGQNSALYRIWTYSSQSEKFLWPRQRTLRHAPRLVCGGEILA